MQPNRDIKNEFMYHRLVSSVVKAVSYANAKNPRYEIRVIEAYRTLERQNYLYSKGRTKDGSVVTHAQGGESYHNYGAAIDIGIFDKRNGSYKTNGNLYRGAEKVFNNFGLNYLRSSDLAHFQIATELDLPSIYKKKIKEGWEHSEAVDFIHIELDREFSLLRYWQDKTDFRLEI